MAGRTGCGKVSCPLFLVFLAFPLYLTDTTIRTLHITLMCCYRTFKELVRACVTALNSGTVQLMEQHWC